jgi:hypothetical protein
VQGHGLQSELKRQEEGYQEESISGMKNSLMDLLLQLEYNTGNQMPYPFKRDIKKRIK